MGFGEFGIAKSWVLYVFFKGKYRFLSGLSTRSARGRNTMQFAVCGPYKGPRTFLVYTLAPKYLYRDYFKAKVYTIWAHGMLGTV